MAGRFFPMAAPRRGCGEAGPGCGALPREAGALRRGRCCRQSLNKLPYGSRSLGVTQQVSQALGHSRASAAAEKTVGCLAPTAWDACRHRYG